MVRALLSAFAVLLLGTTAAVAAPRTYTVVIDGMKFGPLPPVVKLGDTIIWVNRDIFQHSATAANGSFDVDLKPGAKARIVLKTVGSIPFICRYHPGMRGVLKVAR
jgi:plastocyanin